jgi:hypothetical protein
MRHNVFSLELYMASRFAKSGRVWLQCFEREAHFDDLCEMMSHPKGIMFRKYPVPTMFPPCLRTLKVSARVIFFEWCRNLESEARNCWQNVPCHSRSQRLGKREVDQCSTNQSIPKIPSRSGHWKLRSTKVLKKACFKQYELSRDRC